MSWDQLGSTLHLYRLIAELAVAWWMFSTVVTVGFCCSAWMLARYRPHRTLSEAAWSMIGWFAVASLAGVCLTLGGETLILRAVN